MTEEENAARETFLADFRNLLSLHRVTIDTDESVALGDVLLRGNGWFVSILEEADSYPLKSETVNYRQKAATGGGQ